MKKLLALLLTLVLSLGLLPGACADEGIQEEEIGDQAFSLALACRLNGYEGGEPDSVLLWDAVGWYAALQKRVNGYDLLSERDVSEFLKSLNFSGDLRLPEGWEKYDIVRTLCGTDGNMSYDFVSHKNMLNEMLGVTLEVSTAILDAHTAVTTQTLHYETGDLARWAYRFRFERNKDENGEFPYCIAGIEVIDFRPEMDNALNFTWDELVTANSLENILNLYPSLCIYPQDGSYGRTWLFRQNGETVNVSEGEDYATGQYGVFSFEWETTESGAKRVRVGEISGLAGTGRVRNSYVSDYFSDLVSVGLQRVEGDLFRLDCTTINGERVRMAIDRGTLILREITYDYVNYPSSTICFDCLSPAPEFSFLDGWNGELRTVTAIWEEFSSGEPRTHTEFVRLPGDWEYLPYEGRWGDYTVYMNVGYTRPYRYPGDGMDYTIYLTTAKG